MRSVHNYNHLLIHLLGAKIFPFALWIDGARLSERTSSRSLHPILLIPLGLPLDVAVSQKAYWRVGYVSSDADYIAAAYILGK